MDKKELLAPLKYNIVQEVEKFAQDHSRIALKWEDELGSKREITYYELICRVNQIGNALLTKGLQKGQKVLIIVPRVIEAYQVYLSALKVGLVVIPSSEMLRKKDIEYRLHHGEVEAVICFHEFIEQFEDIDTSPIHMFSVGEHIAGWLPLDSLADLESKILGVAETRNDDMAFLSYT